MNDSITCPIDGCDYVLKIPKKGSTVIYMALYSELEQHIIEHHVIRQLIGYFWRMALQESGINL